MRAIHHEPPGYTICPFVFVVKIRESCAFLKHWRTVHKFYVQSFMSYVLLFMNKTYLLLGGNLGNREKILDEACYWLEKEVASIVRRSSLYETAAWGVTDQPSFLNQVLEIDTIDNEETILAKALDIESKLGRERWEKWHARTIDIDILYFNQSVVDKPHLKIPHPEIPNRRFTLVPLAELAPFLRHPISGMSTLELLRDCPDQLPVKPYRSVGKPVT